MAKKQPRKVVANEGPHWASWVTGLYKIMSLVMTKVGLAGFVVISLVIYIFGFVPQTLKDELTNTWLLFKCVECQTEYRTLVLILIVLLLGNAHFARKGLKMKDQRIKEISREKTMLQEKLTNKQLSSSLEDEEQD